MILVQNLRQLLNGNNLILLCLIAVLFTTVSCDPLKKAQGSGTTNSSGELDPIEGSKRYNPKTGKYEEITLEKEKVDTIRWVDNPRNPPIKSDPSQYGSGDKTGETGNNTDPENPVTEAGVLSTYNVAVLLPFLTNRFKEYDADINAKSILALDFYSGAKLAFDKLSQEGVQLNVSVYDTKANDAETRRVLTYSGVTDAQLIVGPVRKSALKIAAEFAKNNKKTLVSPLRPYSGITKENPFFLQAKPSLKSHCEAITRHVRQLYNTDEVVLVSRDKAAEKNRFKYFHHANAEFDGSSDGPKFEEFIVNSITGDYTDIDLTPAIKEGKTTVFIVPSFSNANFIYGFLRQLRIAKANNDVVVYGMPQWLNYKLDSYDYYEELNVHVSSSSFIDLDKQEIQTFRQQYFYKNGTSPSADAFLGYDLMLYLGRMLQKHGTKFREVLDVEQENYLHTRFEFEKILRKDPKDDSFKAVEKYENKHVNILKFENYHFQLAE